VGEHLLYMGGFDEFETAHFNKGDLFPVQLDFRIKGKLDSYQFSFAQNAQKIFRHLCKPKPYKRLQRLNLVSTFCILYISGSFGWRIDNLNLVVLNVVVKLNR
jgi:hypothetical protein